MFGKFSGIHQGGEASKKPIILIDVDGTLFLKRPLDYQTLQNTKNTIEYKTLWNENKYAFYEDGVIIDYGSYMQFYKFNSELLNLMNTAKEKGFDVQVRTGGDRTLYQRALNIIADDDFYFSVKSKLERIDESLVVAVVDDEPTNSYVQGIKTKSSKALVVDPEQLEPLKELIDKGIVGQKTTSAKLR